MEKTLGVLLLALGLLGVLLVEGCTQMPTEKSGVADLRPQISFKGVGERTRSARVGIDGLDMGAVGDYLDGIASLRIRSGSHVLTVTLGSQVLLDEKFYIGDGVNRSFNVK